MQHQAPAIPDHPAASVARLLLFSGSLRRHSHQSRLLHHFAGLIADACTIDMLTPADVDLPLFDQDLEHSEAMLAKVMALHQRFESADGIIVASPEYNGHVSSYLKNTVDWVSRLPRIDARYAARNAFHGRPLLLASASTGWTGGILGLQNARSVFSYLGCTVVADQICVSGAEQSIVDDQFHFHDGFADHINTVLTRFIALVGSLRVARAPA